MKLTVIVPYRMDVIRKGHRKAENHLSQVKVVIEVPSVPKSEVERAFVVQGATGPTAMAADTRKRAGRKMELGPVNVRLSPFDVSDTIAYAGRNWMAINLPDSEPSRSAVLLAAIVPHVTASKWHWDLSTLKREGREKWRPMGDLPSAKILSSEMTAYVARIKAAQCIDCDGKFYMADVEPVYHLTSDPEKDRLTETGGEWKLIVKDSQMASFESDGRFYRADQTAAATSALSDRTENVSDASKIEAVGPIRPSIRLSESRLYAQAAAMRNAFNMHVQQPVLRGAPSEWLRRMGATQAADVTHEFAEASNVGNLDSWAAGFNEKMDVGEISVEQRLRLQESMLAMVTEVLPVIQRNHSDPVFLSLDDASVLFNEMSREAPLADRDDAHAASHMHL